MKLIQRLKQIFSNHWFAFFVLLILAFSSKLFLDPTQPVKFILLGIFCLLGNIWILRKVDRFLLSKESLLFFKVYLLFIAINITSLFFVTNIITGVYEVLKLVLYLNSTIISLLYFKKEEKLNLRSLSISISIFQYIALFALMLSIYDILSLDYKYIGKTYGGLFINPNLTSQLLLLSIPLAWMGLERKSSKQIYYLQITGIIFSFIGIIYLSSKTVWITGVIAFGVSFWNYIYFFKKVNRKFLIRFAVVVISVTSIFAWQNKESIKNLHSSKHRIELWFRTLPIIKENPLFGGGLGNWRINNLNHVPWEDIEKGNYPDIGLYTSSGNIFYERPHNDFIWVMSDLGVVTGLVYLFLFICLFFIILKSFQRKEKENQFRQLLLLTGLISYFLFAQVSFPKERIEQSLLLAIISAFILLGSNHKTVKYFSSKLIYPFVLISLISICFGFSRAKSDYYMVSVKQNKLDLKWQNTLTQINKMELKYYPFTSAGQPVYLYKGIAEMNLRRTEHAYESFLKAKQLNPNHLFVLSNLGAYHSVKGNLDSSVYYYREALKINPNFADARINMVATYFNTNELDSAWIEIQKIPINTIHPKTKLYFSTILEAKFGDELIKGATENWGLEQVNEYISSKKFFFYFLHKQSISNGTTLQHEFLKGLNKNK